MVCWLPSVLPFFAWEELWSLSVPAHHGPNSMGDNLIYAAERLSQGVVPICLPAHWSSPLIDAVGHVYVGRVDGKLYKARGPNESRTSLRYLDLGPSWRMKTLSTEMVLW